MIKTHLKAMRRVIHTINTQTVVGGAGLQAAKHTQLQPFHGSLSERFPHQRVRARLVQQQVAAGWVHQTKAGSGFLIYRHHFLPWREGGKKKRNPVVTERTYAEFHHERIWSPVFRCGVFLQEKLTGSMSLQAKIPVIFHRQPQHVAVFASHSALVQT